MGCDNAYYKEGSRMPCDHQPTGVEHSHWVTGLDRIRIKLESKNYSYAKINTDSDMFCSSAHTTV